MLLSRQLWNMKNHQPNATSISRILRYYVPYYALRSCTDSNHCLEPTTFILITWPWKVKLSFRPVPLPVVRRTHFAWLEILVETKTDSLAVAEPEIPFWTIRRKNMRPRLFRGNSKWKSTIRLRLRYPPASLKDQVFQDLSIYWLYARQQSFQIPPVNDTAHHSLIFLLSSSLPLLIQPAEPLTIYGWLWWG